MFWYYDSYYLILVLPALLIAAWAQFNIQSTFKKFSAFLSRRGKTAADVAREILNENSLHAIEIQRVNGNLTDHFDPRKGVIRLSDSVFDSTSVASIGVAAHEVGHAIQHNTGYLPIKWRNAVLPVANIGSSLSVPLILLGIIFSLESLVTAGIWLFAAIVLFQLVTLPVEFNASRRAIKTLATLNILEEDELGGAKKVLKAAAMTYVASVLVSLMQLVRLVLISGRRNR